MPQEIFLGIDLGGTKIEIIALNKQDQILFSKRIATPNDNNPLQQYMLIIEAIENLIAQCEAKLNIHGLPVGIGLPGAISLKTGKIKNANTTCLIGKDFKKDLQLELKRDIYLENDANCFALSEATQGAGKSAQTVFGVILGTGVGGGLVIHNKLLTGANAIAGEWGHNPLPWSDQQDEPRPTCYCGKKGCIETYLSGPGFARQANLTLGLASNSKLDSRQIIAQRNNNPLAQQAYEGYVKRLAKSLASIINILDPEVIVLGGGLSNIDSLYQDVPVYWGEYVFSDEVNTKLVKHKFGDSSGVRGAAYLVRAE